VTSRPQSKAAPNPKKTRRSAEIISVEELEALGDLRLAQRALAGDVDAIIAWLTKFAGPEWQPR
jgi:hypothetical protein